MHHCRTVLVKCTKNEIEQNGEINLYVLETFFLPSLPVYYILQHFVKDVNKYLISNFSLVLNAVVFFWVIPRRQNFMCRRFGTLFLPAYTAYEDGTECFETSAHKIQTQKKEYSLNECVTGENVL